MLYHGYSVKSKIGTQPALPTVSGTSGAGSEDVCNEEVNRTPIHFHAFYCISDKQSNGRVSATQPSSAFKLE